MFLKTESFEHNGVTVTLSELSALQRIEHLALMKRQAEQAESDSNRQVTVEDVIRTGAFVVAMSLWHNHPKKTRCCFHWNHRHFHLPLWTKNLRNCFPW